MWKKSFLVFLFSVSTAKAELDPETMKKTNQCTSPHLFSKTDVVMKGQNVSLICSSQNKSQQITYSLFWHLKHIGRQNSSGEPVIFNLSISEAHDFGPYKCKAEVSNCSKYSKEFNFTLVDPVSTPVLNITVQTGRYVTLRCIAFKGSLPINYTFFEKGIAMSPVIPKYVREPAEFNLTKSTGEGEEYKCKAKNRLPDHAKYSHPITMPSTGGDSCPLCLQLLLPVLLLALIATVLLLAFGMLPKYKARKARRAKVPRDCANTPLEVRIYTNIDENQADKASARGLDPKQNVSTAQHETEYSQEIHYATPIFQKTTSRDHEACNDKTGQIYSELIF